MSDLIEQELEKVSELCKTPEDRILFSVGMKAGMKAFCAEVENRALARSEKYRKQGSRLSSQALAKAFYEVRREVV